jgi:hypothetical protein
MHPKGGVAVVPDEERDLKTAEWHTPGAVKRINVQGNLPRE